MTETTEQPNQNALIVKMIQGLLSQINNKIMDLTVLADNSKITHKRTKLKGKALEEIDLFEKTTLFELQKAFE